jgi:hypothetical protein
MSKNPVTEGTHEDHVRAGQQSHKNSAAPMDSKSKPANSKSESASKTPAGNQGGTHEQHVNAGKQSHKSS